MELFGLLGNANVKNSTMKNKTKKNNSVEVVNAMVMENVKNGAMKNKKNNSVEVVNAMVMENVKNGAMKNKKNNAMNVVGTVVVEPKNQMGGVAPVNFRYPANMQQPSEEVMKWATTAGMATPPANMMRNVAHGGARKTRKNKSKNHKKQKKAHKSHKKAKKTHKRRGHDGKKRK